MIQRVFQRCSSWDGVSFRSSQGQTQNSLMTPGLRSDLQQQQWARRTWAVQEPENEAFEASNTLWQWAINWQKNEREEEKKEKKDHSARLREG